VPQKFGYLCNFRKKLPKVNNRPIGQKSPNLVTLVLTEWLSLFLGRISPTHANHPIKSKNLASKLRQKEGVESRVARWFIFIPKIPIWVNFVVPGNGKGWYILLQIGIYYGHLVHVWPFGNLVAIWYIFPRFGILCREKSGNPGRKP
jgi:hypothetical protein